MKTAITFLSSLFAFGIFTSISLADAPSQNAPIKTLPAGQLPIDKQRLNFAVGAGGLTSLEFNRQPLLSSAECGRVAGVEISLSPSN